MSNSEKQEWTTQDYSDEDRGVVKPPILPIILQVLLILLSAIIFIISPIDKYLIFGLVGYVITPFLVVALLAYVRAVDLNNRIKSNYDRALGRKYQFIAGILAISSFMVALPIIWRIALEIASELGA